MSKVAVVGIVGRTNAGKSTLVNRLVGEKVSIVSPVEQTTRNTVRGIVSDERGQLVLLDTPGLHKAVGRLGTILNRMARRSAAGVDVLCVVFDAAQEPQLEDVGWMQRVAKERPEKVLFVLNKADRSPFFETMFRDAWKEAAQLCAATERASQSKAAEAESAAQSCAATERASHGEAAESASACAATERDGRDALPRVQDSDQGSGRAGARPSQDSQIEPRWVKSIASTEGGANAVMDALFELAEEGEPLFDDDIVTDYPRKLTIADSIREKYLAKLHQELPHELGICVKDIVESENRWDVKVDVIVNRNSQKPIVIGRGAEIIKYVRKCAERELKDLFGLKVALELWVRVEPNWMKNERLLAEMGYLGNFV